VERIHLMGKSTDGRRLLFGRPGDEHPRFEVPITEDLREAAGAEPPAEPPPEPDHEEGHVRLFPAPVTEGPIRTRGRPEGGLPPGAFRRATRLSGHPAGSGLPRGIRSIVGEGGTALVPATPEPGPEAEPVAPAQGDASIHTIRSKLSAGEIQIRLRAGRTPAEVARDSGAPEDWVRRLDETIRRERVAAVGQMLNEPMTRPEHGRSAELLGDALAANLRRRGVRWDPARATWSAARPRSGPWRIRLTYRDGGRERWAEWRFEPRLREVTPADRLAAEIGWADPAPEPKPS